jgi:hypothetical protein
MLNRIFRAAALACALAAAPLAALAGPISGYPAATTPLSGAETTIGTQAGSTVQITTASIAAIVTAATNSWTGVQTFPAPGASHGSIVLTPGAATGTPPNGSIWVTSTGLDFQAGGLTQQAVGNGANAWTGKQSFVASATGGAGVNLGAGVAPASPVNGDLWATSGGLFAQIGGSTVQFTSGGVTQSGSVIAGDCVKWNATSVIADALVPCGGGSGSGVPGGPNGSIQFENGTSFAGTANFTYTTPGGVPTITGPDGGKWTTTGVQLGSGKDLDVDGGFIVSNTTPLIFSPQCAGATWLIGPGTGFCSHDTAGGTDNIGIGTIVFDSLTSGFGNTTGGSENMHLLTTGSNNTSWGFESLHDVTTGNSNSALGSGALESVTTGSFNIGIGLGAGADIDTGSNNICVGGCGTLGAGSFNVEINGSGTLTSGSHNLFIGANGGAGQGIVAGSGNVWLGGQCTSLSDQSDSVTIADSDASSCHILLQYTTAQSYLSIKQPVRSSGNFVGMAATTVSGLTSADSSPVAGDRGFVTDATACTFNSTVTGGGSTKCPVVYSGSAWVAG